MREKISVIVPVFNLEKEVKKCLFSLVLQKYENLEIIIVDDGSKDNSFFICKEVAKKDKRIKVFHKKNGGLSSARNFGISKASGKFLAFVDGDDFVSSDFLGNLHAAISETKADIAISGYTENCGEKMINFVPKNEVISGEDALIRLLTKQDNMEILTWNKLYKRSLFAGIKFPDGKNCEDNLTTYKLFFKAAHVCYVNESLYNYCRRDDSISLKMGDLELCEIREQAAEETEKFLKTASKKKDFENSRVFQAIEYSKLLAYFKFIDRSLLGNISENYFKIYREKILKEKEAFLENPFTDFKRKKYIKMIASKDGNFYKFYRKIKHD